LEFNFKAGENPVSDFFTQNPTLLREPTWRERLEASQAETELFGYAASGHPLELFEDIAWEAALSKAQSKADGPTVGDLKKI
jgi:hypothetical protein